MTHQEFIDNYLSSYAYEIKDGILYIDSWLDLENQIITSLPDNLSVGYWMDLRCTNITKLPKGLVVGSWLSLEGLKITLLPECLSVGDRIYSNKKYKVSEQAQLNLIKQNESYFNLIFKPTEKAIALNNLLWRI